MASLSKLLSFQSVTLAACLESFLAIRVLPAYLESSRSPLATASLVFLGNYSLWMVFWLFIHPIFLSPLRKLAGPRAIFKPTDSVLLQKDRIPGDIWIETAQAYPGEDLILLNSTQRRILMTSPRYLADVLVHRAYDFVKPPRIANFLRHVLGDGLVVLEGAEHKFMRRNTMPAFAFRHIKDLYPMMWTKAGLLTQAMRAEEDFSPAGEGDKAAGTEATIELSNWMSRATLDIIGIAGLGRNFDVLHSAEDPLLKLYEEITDPSPDKLTFAALSFVFGLRLVRLIPWRMNTVFHRISTSLSAICAPMIRDKREAIAKHADDHFDVLSLLIKSGNFSDEQLKDQLLTFLAAGHETTSSSMCWATYLLAKHQDMQAALRAEVQAALLPSPGSGSGGGGGGGDGDDQSIASTLEGLPLLNGVINETLRLYPTVPVTMRQAIRDTRLGDHQAIPEGTTLILSMWLMNRSPDVWGEGAAEFRPERWIDDVDAHGTARRPNQTGGASNNYQFLTFLHGPRSCIGQAFAKAEMRCLLAALIGTFSWDLGMEEEKIIPRGVITIKPAQGLYLKMKPLDSVSSS